MKACELCGVPAEDNAFLCLPCQRDAVERFTDRVELSQPPVFESIGTIKERLRATVEPCWGVLDLLLTLALGLMLIALAAFAL